MVVKSKLKIYLKNFWNRNFAQQMVKVYSHPRSGTHFLEAFIAENFYKEKNLSTDNVNWGHWSNRKINSEGNPYGKLFGSHHFPKKKYKKEFKIYIVRDGRAVAYSIWKTPNFIHKDLKNISFHDFLNLQLDWKGTPATKSEPKLSILEHWYEHVKAWEEASLEDDNLLLVKYEELIKNPYSVYLQIQNKFFRKNKLLSLNELDIIKKPVGLLPNKAIVNSWEKEFSDKDKLLYEKILSKGLDSFRN
jgi:hypothetical protein